MDLRSISYSLFLSSFLLTKADRHIEMMLLLIAVAWINARTKRKKQNLSNDERG